MTGCLFRFGLVALFVIWLLEIADFGCCIDVFGFDCRLELCLFNVFIVFGIFCVLPLLIVWLTVVIGV